MLAVVLHGHEATAAGPETGLSSRARQSSGAASFEAVRPGAAVICALSQTRVTRVQARVYGQGPDRRTAPIRCAIVRKYCW
jgi:hypothetical protein